MAKISEFQYAYFKCETERGGAAMIRIKIPMTLHRSFEPEVKLVFSNPSESLPSDMGLFSHNHIVYMVGGHNGRKVVDYGLKDDDDDESDVGSDVYSDYGVEYKYEYSDLVHMFDPTKFHQIPVENIERLDNLKCAPCMVLPDVIRAEDRIYLFSHCDFFDNYFDKNGERLDVNGPLNFQYFDPNKNLFVTLPPPPLPTDHNGRRISVWCHFFLRGYIYVFITDGSAYSQTSKFDTIKLEWEDCKSMVDRFEEKNIPFPFSHVGDMGISDEFVDNTWILVALNRVLPTAYHVRISGNGDIEPISHRVLAECNIFDFDMRYSVRDSKQLADMGGGRFCVMHGTDMSEDFLIYVFRINFALERTIQISNSGGCSSDVIFKTKFNPKDTVPLNFSVIGFCIASVPPGNEEKEGE